MIYNRFSAIQPAVQEGAALELYQSELLIITENRITYPVMH